MRLVFSWFARADFSTIARVHTLSLSLSLSLRFVFQYRVSVCNSVRVCVFSSIWPWMPPEDYGVRVRRVPQGSSSSSTSPFFFFFFFFFFFSFFFTLRIPTTVGYANIVSPMGLSLLPSSRDGDGLHDFASNARWVARTIQEQEETRDPAVAGSQSLGVSSSVFERMLQGWGERKCGTTDHFHVALIQTDVSDRKMVRRMTLEKVISAFYDFTCPKCKLLYSEERCW